MDDRYDVEPVVCHACAALERTRENRNSVPAEQRLHGEYLLTHIDHSEPLPFAARKRD
jgi:hypothetical protein